MSMSPSPARAGLTRQQAKVLSYVRGYISEHGCSPSFEEIGDAVGLRSRSGVHRHVHALARRGALIMIDYGRRSLAPSDETGCLKLHLPPEINGRLSSLAERAGVTPEEFAIEALRDCLFALR